jgi:sugar phosphate isomerase/epimerase
MPNGEHRFKGRYMQMGPAETQVTIPTGRFGVSTHPGKNQLTEMNLDANWGVKNIELSMIAPTVIEKTPDWYYDEMRRISKLTGVSPSLHAPVINLAGLSPREKVYSDSERTKNELMMKHMIDRAGRIGADTINVHASEAVYGKLSYLQEEEGKKPEEIVEYQGYVDQDTKTYHAFPRREGWYKGEIRTLKPEELARINERETINNMIYSWGDVAYRLGMYDKVVLEVEEAIKGLEDQYGKDLLKKRKVSNEVWQRYQDKLREFAHFGSLMQREKEKENEISGEIKKHMKNFHPGIKKRFKRYKNINKAIDSHKKAMIAKHGSDEKYIEYEAKKHYDYLEKEDQLEYKRRIKDDMHRLKGRFHLFGVVYPEDELKRFVPVTDFERPRAAETAANAAFYAYKKYGDKAPKLAIENPYAYVSFGRMDEFVEMLKESRKKLAEKFVTNKGFTEGRAKTLAKKLIGANFDVAHINLLRQYGYKKEDIMKEAKKILPYVEYFHASDNFGYEDSHLVPGWGNTPVKEVLKELEKRGYKGKTILETGGAEQLWEESRGASPHPLGPALATMGAAMYESRPMGERWTEFTDEFSRMYSPEFPTTRDWSYGYNVINYGSFTGRDVPFENIAIPGTHKAGERRGAFGGAPMA